MKLKENDNIVFLGDDNVSGGQHGFVQLVKRAYPQLDIRNHGKVSARIIDLQNDVHNYVNDNTKVVYIMMGNQDAYQLRNDKALGKTETQLNFRDAYQYVLKQIFKKKVPEVILIEPFYVTHGKHLDFYRFALDDYRYVVRHLAMMYKCRIIGLDGILNSLTINNTNKSYTLSPGILLSDRGHDELAEIIIEQIEGWIPQ